MIGLVIGICLSILFIQGDSAVAVRPEVSTVPDVLRVYVFPAMSTLLMGVVAIILEWIRRAVLQSSSRTLAAAANAKIAADNAEKVGVALKEESEKQLEKLDKIEKLHEENRKAFNDGAEQAHLQIEALAKQIAEGKK